MHDFQTWLSEGVAFYRRLGLFAAERDVPDAALVARLMEDFESRSEELGLPMEEDGAELTLLSCALGAAYHEDLEAGVCQENQVYKTTLEWISANLTRGAFSAQNVREHWASEEGPITLTFTLDGVEQRIALRYEEDWMDEGFFSAVDGFLSAGGYRLVHYDMGDQTIFLLVLTDAEKQRIEQERGLRLGYLQSG